MKDEERFFAWIDGELVFEEAQIFEALVAEVPELQELARQHGAFNERLKRAFDSAMERSPVLIPRNAARAPEPAVNRMVEARDLLRQALTIIDQRMGAPHIGARLNDVIDALSSQMLGTVERYDAEPDQAKCESKGR